MRYVLAKVDRSERSAIDEEIVAYKEAFLHIEKGATCRIGRR
jgi:hypothetical protein